MWLVAVVAGGVVADDLVAVVAGGWRLVAGTVVTDGVVADGVVAVMVW